MHRARRFKRSNTSVNRCFCLWRLAMADRDLCQSLFDREKEKRKKEEKEMAKQTAAQAEAAEAMDPARLLLEQAGTRRKRKRKVPKSSSSCSSRSSRGARAARTQKSGFFSSNPSAVTCTLFASWFDSGCMFIRQFWRELVNSSFSARRLASICFMNLFRHATCVRQSPPPPPPPPPLLFPLSLPPLPPSLPSSARSLQPGRRRAWREAACQPGRAGSAAGVGGARGPTLALADLGGGSEMVDASALSWLADRALNEQRWAKDVEGLRHLQERLARMAVVVQKQDEERAAWLALWKRKRKKRRKKRLPHTLRQGFGRPCDHAAQVPAVLRVPHPASAADSVPRTECRTLQLWHRWVRIVFLVVLAPLSLAPSVLACTVVRTGSRAFHCQVCKVRARTVIRFSLHLVRRVGPPENCSCFQDSTWHTARDGSDSGGYSSRTSWHGFVL